MVTAAVIKGRIRMWHYVEGKWNAAAAAQMYKGPLQRALRRAYPSLARQRSRKFLVLEDNDPTGYKSRMGIAAKAEARIRSEDLPRRSSDLNVLDYSLWHATNERMREQEKQSPANRKDTKEKYLERLRATALGLPRVVVEEAVRNMHERVRKVVAAKGGLFIE